MDDISRMPDSKIIQDEINNVQGVAEPRNFEEYWINSVGKALYNKMIKSYNQKMWQVEDNKDIDTFNWSPKGVTIKEGPKAAWDTAISAYPYAHDGYNHYFDLFVLLTVQLLKYLLELVGQPHLHYMMAV